MYQQEKIIYTTIFSTIFVFVLYGVKIYEMYQQGLFSDTNASSLLGKSILLLIFANVLVNAAMQSLLFKVSKIRDSLFSDERDKLIQLKGMQISYLVLGGGFILSMCALALEWSGFVVFNLIVLCIIASEITGGLAKLYQYRKGY